MRAILDYCTGGIQRSVSAGTLIIHEGGTTGHLYRLIEDGLKSSSDTVVAIITEPRRGAGEMSVCSISPIPPPCARRPIRRLRDRRCRIVSARPTGVALLIAALLAQRLNVANHYLADIMQQYAGTAITSPMVARFCRP